MIQIAMLALAGTMAAQEPSTPPPPATPQVAPTPAPAPKARPRAKVYTYTTAPAVAGSGSYLGVDVRDVKNGPGVEITMVDQDSPAGKAGLKEHDVVVSFNGQKLESAEQLRRLIRETKPGQNVVLGITRDGQPQTLNATLGNRSKLYAAASPKVWKMETPRMTIRIPDIEVPSFVWSQSSRRNGVTVENLTGQLGEYFGVKNGEGVLVRSVEKGSKAEAAGLKAGDVIIRVDSERVSDTREWSRLLRSHDAGTVKLGIMRDRREQTLSLVLPDQKSADESESWFVGPDMEQFRMQMQNFGPQFAKDQSELQSRIAREWAAHQKEIQQAMRDAQREMEHSLREAQTEREHDLRDAQRDRERALRDAQKEREKALRDAQRERERVLREKQKEKEKDIDE